MSATFFERFIVGALLILSLATWVQHSHAQVAACSDVFPGPITEETSNTLDLPPFPEPNGEDVEWENDQSLTAGTYYFEDLEISNNVEVSLSDPVLIFVEGGVEIGNNVVINSPGNPADFVLISYDDIDIGNNSVVNGLLYAREDIELENNVMISGAVTSEEGVETKPNTAVSYDPSAVENADFGGLCNNGTAPEAELVAEWRMDEAEWDGSSGEIIDSSGNGNDGTAQTGDNADSLPNTAPGKVCRAGRFRGEGFHLDEPQNPWIPARHYADVPDAPSLSPLDDAGAMSIGGWFRMEETGGRLIHKGEGGYSQEYRVSAKGGRLKFTLWNRYGSPDSMTVNSQSLSTDTWYFYAITALRLPGGDDVLVRGHLYDESGQIGAVSEQTLNVDYTNKETNGRLFLAAESFGNTPVNFFEGLLDEMRIYSGILEQSEIDAFWANTRPCPDAAELLLEYRFEQSSYDGNSDEVEDTSGNDRHGATSGDASSEINDPAIPGNPGTCRYASFKASENFRDGGYVQTPGVSQLLNDTATMTFWIRTSQSSDNSEAWQSPGIAGVEEEGGTDDIFWGWIDQAGRIGISVGDDFSAEQKSTQAINDGAWRHVALTWDRDSGDTQIYIDGVLDQTGNTGNGQVIGNSFFGIGRIGNTSSGIPPHYFDGDLDEVRIYKGVLDAGQIAAIRNATWPCETGYDHIRLEHPETGLTCSPARITVKACAEADCTSLSSDPVDVHFTSPAANWTPDPVTFTGSAQVSLQYTTQEFVTLDAVAIDPAAANPTRCFTTAGVETNCEMQFLDSGFVIDIPDHVADVAVNGTIAAVRSDPGNPEQCVPGFDNETKDVNFWSQYFNPGTGSLQASINGNAIATAEPGTSLPIAFDAGGVGSFQLRYPDVGKVTVNARYVGSGKEDGLIMNGQDEFVARPAYFTLDIPSHPDPAATDDEGSVFKAAGEEFKITVAARNANNGITPNFGRESTPEEVDLELALAAPSGGAEPGLSGSFGSFGLDCNGNSATPGMACGDDFSWDEVGIISLEPHLKSGGYLGTADVVGSQVDHVGRFIPDHFKLGTGDIVDRAGVNGCDSSPFTYIGERFDTEFTLYARNANGVTTSNYEGDFGFLGGDDLNLSGSPAPDTSSKTITWTGGIGVASARLALPRSSPEGPYPNYEVITEPVDSDGVSLQGDDDIDSTELRYGRIVIDNAIGSELGPLALPWRSEYWNGSTWLTNSDDDCTALDLASDVQLISSGGNSGDGTTPVSLGGGTTSIDAGESDLTLASGAGSIRFTTPGAPGWVDVLLELDTNWPYLRDDLNDNSAYDDNPEARASFGLFDGNSQRIYIREISPR